MPAAAGAFIVRDSLVEITAGSGGAVVFSNQVDEATLTPEQESQTRPMLDPDGTLSDVASPTWTLNLNGVQDYVAGRGLARLLTDNAGKKLQVRLESRRGEVAVTCEVTAKAVAYGGKAGEWAELAVELPVTGQPEFIDPDATVA